MSSFFKKMGYAAETFKDVVKGAAEGKESTVSQKEADKRLEICKGCEFYKEFAGTPRCDECGCMMKLKTKLTNAKCPKGKW